MVVVLNINAPVPPPPSVNPIPVVRVSRSPVDNLGVTIYSKPSGWVETPSVWIGRNWVCLG